MNSVNSIMRFEGGFSYSSKRSLPLLPFLGLLTLLFSMPTWAVETDYQQQFNTAKNLSLSDSTADLQQAEQQWQALLKIYPDDLAVTNNLAVTQMKLKNYDAAQKKLEAALNADPKIAVILENLNEIYAFQAQQAYKSVFKASQIKSPQGQWISLASGEVKTPDQAKMNKIQQNLQKVVNLTENWRLAWSGQDYDQYVSFYKSDFSGQFESNRQWRNGRRYSLKTPDYIKVELKELASFPLSETMIEVTFYQAYESNRFKDTVKKMLVWQNTDKGWKIAKEQVVYQ